MIMIPVIVCTLIVGASSISPAHLGKVGVKIIAFYMATSLCAIVIGLFVGSVLQPGIWLELAHITGVTKEAKSSGLVEILLNIIPANPFGSIANAEVLPTICFCLFFGIALVFYKDSESQAVRNAAENVCLFFEGMSSVMFKVVGWVMQYAPIGVFALIFIVF